MADVEHLDEITPDGFADVMDCFVASGFRHTLMPMVTAVQLAALDDARRFLRPRQQIAGAPMTCFVTALHTLQ